MKGKTQTTPSVPLRVLFIFLTYIDLTRGRRRVVLILKKKNINNGRKKATVRGWGGGEDD